MSARGTPVRSNAPRVLVAWGALIALMLASLGSAYLPMGPWNIVASIAIALAKSAIVLWWFMGLSRASPLLRIVAGVGAATLLLLIALSQVDEATRPRIPAPVQQAQPSPALHR